MNECYDASLHGECHGYLSTGYSRFSALAATIYLDYTLHYLQFISPTT